MSIITVVVVVGLSARVVYVNYGGSNQLPQAHHACVGVLVRLRADAVLVIKQDKEPLQLGASSVLPKDACDPTVHVASRAVVDCAIIKVEKYMHHPDEPATQHQHLVHQSVTVVYRTGHASQTRPNKARKAG